MEKWNGLLARALEVAAEAHAGDNRKGMGVPYIVHPFEVALILQENGMPEEIIAAGILHDTLEDTDINEDDIKDIFGERILNLVLGASEELKDRDKTPWEVRKNKTIEYLKNAPRDVQYIACADKLSNTWSMLRDYEKIGDNLWYRFNRGYEKQKWYYTNLLKSLADLEGVKMYEDLKTAVKTLFNLTGSWEGEKNEI